MTPQLLFRLASTLALGGWLLLALFGRRRPVASLVSGAVLPLVFAVAYGALIASHFSGAKGGFDSLDHVALLFRDPWILLAGWIHYLAFDLFIGSWEVRDARRLGISHWAVLPCLALTFLFGPLGLLAYFLVRRRLGADEGAFPQPAARGT